MFCFELHEAGHLSGLTVQISIVCISLNIMDRKSSVQSNMKRDVSLRDSLPEQGTSKQVTFLHVHLSTRFWSVVNE